jgi:putative ABC transport system substrate-binding protein
MNRRAFIAGLGGAAAWPLVARGQQQAMPVVGFLNYQSPETLGDLLRAFRQGLKETGYVEGENVAIAYRFAENQAGRLPELAADLVRRRVAVIATTGGPPSAFAAKAATSTIPTVFAISEDPVRVGLVDSLARPGGNLTGFNFFTAEVVAKRLELLHELVPGAARIAVLVNPANSTTTASTLREVKAVAPALGLQLKILNASTSGEINAAFAELARDRADALFVAGDAFFFIRRAQMVNLASRYAIIATYSSRDFPEAGGLMSYGTNLTETFRQVGIYVGRILKGAKPAELPIVQLPKFEMVINNETARMLGLTVPPTLLARADEVIE